MKDPNVNYSQEVFLVLVNGVLKLFDTQLVTLFSRVYEPQVQFDQTFFHFRKLMLPFQKRLEPLSYVT